MTFITANDKYQLLLCIMTSLRPHVSISIELIIAGAICADGYLHTIATSQSVVKLQSPWLSAPESGADEHI